MVVGCPEVVPEERQVSRSSRWRSRRYLWCTACRRAQKEGASVTRIQEIDEDLAVGDDAETAGVEGREEFKP